MIPLSRRLTFCFSRSFGLSSYNLLFKLSFLDFYLSLSFFAWRFRWTQWGVTVIVQHHFIPFSDSFFLSVDCVYSPLRTLFLVRISLQSPIRF